MGDCRIKSFVASFGEWDISWRWSKGGKSTIRLPVKFRLELEPGSSKADCIVGQYKRGSMRDANGTDTFSDWTIDGPIGDFWWWNGKTMSTAGFGEWDSGDLVATFKDKPGFNGAEGSLFMGDAKGGPYYFDFRTLVKTNVMEKEIKWSMRIDVPNPGKGGMWWSFSDQK